jgi:RimJ/RimL family protein N-acetyltransferase
MTNNMWEGELVRLRGVRADDWETFVAWDADSDAQRYGWMVFAPQGTEAAKAWAREQSELRRPSDDTLRFVIETLDGTAVGSVQTHNCDRINRRFEYGIGLGREHWGHGYAEEALKLLLRFMFAERGYNKVNAWVYTYNERSRKMHEKLGMVLEGTARETHFSGGEFHDEYLLGMTAGEFFQRYGK